MLIDLFNWLLTKLSQVPAKKSFLNIGTAQFHQQFPRVMNGDVDKLMEDQQVIKYKVLQRFPVIVTKKQKKTDYSSLAI